MFSRRSRFQTFAPQKCSLWMFLSQAGIRVCECKLISFYRKVVLQSCHFRWRYSSSGALDSQKSIEGQWMVSFRNDLSRCSCMPLNAISQCAGGEGRDVCQGFGGAPLLITETSLGVSVTNQIGGPLNLFMGNIWMWLIFRHNVFWIWELRWHQNSERLHIGKNMNIRLNYGLKIS